LVFHEVFVLKTKSSTFFITNMTGSQMTKTFSYKITISKRIYQEKENIQRKKISREQHHANKKEKMQKKMQIKSENKIQRCA